MITREGLIFLRAFKIFISFTTEYLFTISLNSIVMFKVKPVLNRLKITLIGLAACLGACALTFSNIDESYLTSRETGVRAIPGAYSDESARSFEPDAFCGEPDLQE
jgi:hypothetical protein